VPTGGHAQTKVGRKQGRENSEDKISALLKVLSAAESEAWIIIYEIWV
jgi:hypothetical protein